VRQWIKRSVDLCCVIAVSPSAAMCAIEAALSTHGEAMFTFWAQTFAIVPGLPGVFVRRAFYRLTLDKCARNFYIGFGAIFSHRCVTVEEDVYIGRYALIGASRLRRGCLIGSRASIVSGGGLHALDANLRWMPADLSRLRTIDIGEYVWIGEAALVMADIGRSSMVVAGSVVSGAVPPAIVVAGNPSRFVRHLTDAPLKEEVPPVETAVSVC
jgi:acetyltransferase-like isoleucine patch superfamily enzyme